MIYVSEARGGCGHVKTLAVQGFRWSRCPGSNRHGQLAGVIPLVAAGTYGPAKDPFDGFPSTPSKGVVRLDQEV
jgi:hypothetical protein